ncbi:MAG: hypothetical protein R3178_09430 [Rhodothermales bacterium]|nr:hypothetical protein [Rhodothermales bacterium]
MTSKPLSINIAKWAASLAVAMGIFWVAEVLLNLVVGWGLSWRIDGLFFFLLFIASSLLVLVAMILVAKLVSRATELLAPDYKAGLVLVAVVYVLVQLVRLFGLTGESGPTWQFVGMKIEFALVVLVVFAFDYVRDDDPEAESQPSDEPPGD